jgi:hypothetical protein
MSLFSILRQLFHTQPRKAVRFSRKGRGRCQTLPMVLEALEDRLVPNAVVWNAATGGNWNDANNWLDTDANVAQVPTAADDVSILQSNIAVTVSDSQAAHSLHTSLTSTLVVEGGGSLTLGSDSQLDGGLSLSGSLTAGGTLTLAGTSTWSAGSIDGTGMLINTGTLTLSGGTSLPLGEDLTNNGTLVMGPGTTLALDGDYIQHPGATLDVQLGDVPASGQFGLVKVASGRSVQLDGTLKAELVNGYAPRVGDEFTVMTYPSNAGSSFAETELPISGGVVLQSEVGNGAVLLHGDAVPAIASQPTDLTVTAGDTVTFTASADGTPAPTVQWQVSSDGGLSFSDIAGATSATLSFAASATDNGKEYRAVFANAVGSTTSNAATLTVDFAPAITGIPENLIVNAGQTATFTASASANPAASVQWQVSTDHGASFSDIAGATSTTLSLMVSAADNDNKYRAVFTNSLGMATTPSATLAVAFAPTITSPPGDLTVNAGQPVTFTASADGNPPPTVKWQVSTDHGATFSDLPGATFKTLSFAASAADNGKEYRAVFTNSVGSVTSSAATLTVDFAPRIIAQPTNVAAATGQTAVFTASASANPAATVQWQIGTNRGRSFSDIPGATSTTLSFVVAASQNDNQYRAVFTNSLGTATSGVAMLVVVQARTPAFHSANHATFVAGTAGRFTVVSIGSPAVALSEIGKLPAGLTFHDNGNGTATISGTPGTGTGGTYRLVLLAFNGKSATQSFTLTVSQTVTQPTSKQGPLVVVQPSSQTVMAGRTVTFTAQAQANPAARVQWQVSTNDGVTFRNIPGAIYPNLNVAAYLAKNGYLYQAVFTNSLGTATSATATLRVVKATKITSLYYTTFMIGTPRSFTITTSAASTASLSYIGGLPAGLTFTDKGNGTATLSGTPAAGTAGTYTLIFVADNALGDAIQTFTLTAR